MKTPEQLRELFFNALAEKLEKFFPKGKCMERSAALVLNAEANILFEKFLKKEREELLAEIEGMRIKPSGVEDKVFYIHLRGWNSCIDELINKLKGV